jgi:hypothetical protein
VGWRTRAYGLLGGALLAACSFDFDRYDPRLAEDPSTGATGGAQGAVTSSGASGGATASSSTTAASTGGNGGNGGVGGEAGAGGSPGPQTIVYAPSVAACIFVTAPDPAACLASQAPNTMGVDLAGSMGQEIRSYLRFELDGQLSGKRVTAVTLEITVSMVPNANSSSSGVVYEVEAFTQQTLLGNVPMEVMQLAGDQGAAALGMTVAWPLPVGSVAPNAPLYLGIHPVIADGLDYENDMGMTPPRLLVTVE